MIKLDLQITNEGRYPVNGERLFAAVEKVLEGAYSNTPVQVSLLIVDKEEMAEYNLKYHETAGPTDVLSFPYTDPESQVSEEEFVFPPDVGTVLGDLIVCFPVAEEVAQKEGKTVDEVVEFYVLHGLEHLLGHHHE